MDVDDRTDEYKTLAYDILEERNIQFTLRTKITDLNRKVIGYLGFDYCKGSHVTREMAKRHVETLLNVSTELGALLSVNKKEGAVK